LEVCNEEEGERKGMGEMGRGLILSLDNCPIMVLTVAGCLYI
jgi:hypothetical protein